jgi:hypothetical protein
MPATPPVPAPTSQLHADGLAAFAGGDIDGALGLLRRAVSDACDASVLNDLAVVLAQTGDADGSVALLRASLTVDPDHPDAAENLARLIQGDTADPEVWRRSTTLGGADVRMPERAYPGMPNSSTMSEHAMRYSLALGPVAGRHTLDVGCGTGYGSEMLTWTAASVRGFDLWQPERHEYPRWPGGAELQFGFDICTEPLPPADIAVMFEITEHLHDAPAALRNVFAAVPALVVSFPNPTFHGSHLNFHHVNDWTLDRFDDELRAAASERFASVQLTHLSQPPATPLIIPGRDPQAPFWITIVAGLESRA